MQNYVSHDTTATFWFDNLIWPDIDLDLDILSTRSILKRYPFFPLGSLLAMFGLEGVSSPVSVADKAKSDGFAPWPDLGLTRDLLIIFNCSLSTHRELLIAVSPSSLRPPVRELGFFLGGGTESVPLAGRVRPNTPAGRGLRIWTWLISLESRYFANVEFGDACVKR